ncbi:ras-related protein SEC4-like [Quercus lobata]|uniref:ras-related protein SEC4-like n=1 Tax=Quercus lobata TaxID=97700 RepID=UPI001243FE48|nr:ras-related protein SEC4-like [Quercus lobata]
MNGEDYCKVFSISVYGDHTPLLDSVADSPQIREFSLRDSAGVDTFEFSKQKQFKFLRGKFNPHVIIVARVSETETRHSTRRSRVSENRNRHRPPEVSDLAVMGQIVYDATVMVSFNKAEMWLEENAIPGNGRARMLLVGNDHNLDDNDDNKVVNTDTGKELARRFKISFIETSAENPATLEQALRNMTELIESSKIYKAGAIQMEG